ncbi:phytoene/squalene synthase family protein [Mucilaginibacter sp. UR6-11]|uniref:phytoene/squalene synthase family protein n=1 Tax=Mucilaginibacter sp. UR6-11 TaxID=1435644 RepID=UPI001E4A4853|nr:phytoene/squalene synthase family protein [Mucilaginibacter sp. UR6-11]MCC8426456.1 phytoene/squalene synthase family protein [Mucilaginibacter sp. UR6-11]
MKPSVHVKMDLYDETCFECCKLITNKYSTSFSKGIKAFNKQFRYPIYAIYGFVRYADEIVDTFHNHDKAQLISDFKQDTFKAIDQKISLNPVLHAFQLIVNQYQIDHNLISDFLRSMEMDLDHKVYNETDYQTYIHGSAGVIGLMCLQVFCEGDRQQYEQLKPMALSLGLGFQKINFLRDIKSDYEDRGRTYFPGIDFKNFTQQDKQTIEADIQQDFDKGLEGIQRLPKGVKLGVYIAYRYYLQLFKKIVAMPVDDLVARRVSVNNAHKAWLYLTALIGFS